MDGFMCHNNNNKETLKINPIIFNNNIISMASSSVHNNIYLIERNKKKGEAL